MNGAKSVFTNNFKRTHFIPPSTDTSTIISFNQMISELTPERLLSINKLNNYKDSLLVKKLSNVYIKDILSLIDSLITIYTATPVDSPLFTPVTISITKPLTTNVYDQFLQGNTNNLDPVLFNIFNEIKSKNTI